MAELVQQSELEKREFDKELKSVQELLTKDDDMKARMRRINQFNQKALQLENECNP